MVINEDEFNKRYINDTIIERCLKFLRNEI
jgi:hypothetical protein